MPTATHHSPILERSEPANAPMNALDSLVEDAREVVERDKRLRPESELRARLKER